jgi:hypothetical protein
LSGYVTEGCPFAIPFAVFCHNLGIGWGQP